jgi:hypothetical protein
MLLVNSHLQTGPMAHGHQRCGRASKPLRCGHWGGILEEADGTQPLYGEWLHRLASPAVM